MEILDFRIRPPYKSFKRLGIFHPICNQKPPQKWHGIPSKSAEELSMELFWQEADRAGIGKGVAIGRQVPDDTASVANDDIHALAMEYPDRIIPFGSLDVSRGVAAAMDELERCINMGFRGMAMEPAYCMPPRYVDANVLYPIYARCEQAKLPVVLTMSFLQGNLDYSNPVPVQYVAKDFPGLQIVLAHGCYPWIMQAIQLCQVCRNVWLLPDIYLMNPDAPGNQIFEQAMRWLDGERILFGSAYPCYNMEQGVRDVERYGFSAAHKEKFFHANAEKLLSGAW